MFSKDLNYRQDKSQLTPNHSNIRPRVAVLLFFIFFYSGCGFQLNRHQLILLNSAKSVAFDKIVNESYTPQLDMFLRDSLSTQLSQRWGVIKAPHQADMIVSVFIKSTSVTRSEYALDNSQQIYQFEFNVLGTLSVVDRRSGTQILNNTTVKGSYSLKTSQPDITSLETDTGRTKSIENLGKVILDRITDGF